MAHAYQQISLDDSSKELVMINTHKGLFRYNCLPFGIASAPSIFQWSMETVLQGLPSVCVYLDDILISGTNVADHLKNLEAVLSRLQEASLRLKCNKCAFLLPTVEYLGHKISAQGLQPTNEKIKAILDAPPPKDVTQLCSFLGLINYYGKFLSQLLSTLSPLYRLTQKNAKWNWGPEQQKAFEQAKTSLSSESLLEHYNPEKELILACDASPYGVGAVLSHHSENGQERPIAYASRSLAPAERKYSQLEKESLAIVFGVKKFHQYLFGRHFTILSDHKPLQHLLKETNATPTMASAWIQRWALTLGAYGYTIVTNRELSMLTQICLVISLFLQSPQKFPSRLLMSTIPVTAYQVRNETSRDPVLSRVKDFVLHGWKEVKDLAMKPYLQCQSKLSIQDGCLLWGNRVIVPPVARQQKYMRVILGSPV